MRALSERLFSGQQSTLLFPRPSARSAGVVFRPSQRTGACDRPRNHTAVIVRSGSTFDAVETPSSSLGSAGTLGDWGIDADRLLYNEEQDALQFTHLVSPRPTVDKLLVFCPGSDGTGQSILSQLDSLVEANYDVWSLNLPAENRLGWSGLTNCVAVMLKRLVQEWRAAVPSAAATDAQVILVCESFGGCLGLRVAVAVPQFIRQLVLINSATCYNSSLNGLSSLVSSTNLLSLFNQQLYGVAQETLLPLLVDINRISALQAELLKRMVVMEGAPPKAGQATRVIVASPGSSGAASEGGVPPKREQVAGMSLYGPAAAANFRTNLLRQGNLPDSSLRSMTVPTLIISSARDRLLPSLTEGARLMNLIPNSERLILPDSGHAALLEQNCDLAALLSQVRTQNLPPIKPKHTNSASKAAEATILSGPKAKAQSMVTEEDSWTTWAQILAPWRDLVSPVVLSVENLPAIGSSDWSRPMLFVGNHGKMGFYDTPLLMYELYLRGYRVRGLAHPGHWNGPFGAFFESFGAVRASPLAAFRLLKSKEKVLLFPGGAREVVKRRGEEYQLLWKDTPDFVRLATKCQAIIVPFSAVGADDAYDVLMETEEQLEVPVVGGLLKGLLSQLDSSLKPSESIFPLTRLPGIGIPTPIPVPNLTRLYFKFGEPVDTTKIGLDINNEQQCQQVYDGIRATINRDLAKLVVIRESDDDRDVSARMQRNLKTMIPLMQSIDEKLRA